MRDYAVFKPSFWTGETGRRIRSMGDDAIIVATYLITAPGSNMIGLYYLPIPTLAHETGRGIEGASKALASLSKGGFAHYDEATETVWLPEMARYQIGDALQPRDKRCSSILRQALEHKKSRYFQAFVERYWDLYSLPGTKPLWSPLQAPSEPLRSQDQDQDQDQDQKNLSAAVASAPSTSTPTTEPKATEPTADSKADPEGGSQGSFLKPVPGPKAKAPKAPADPTLVPDREAYRDLYRELYQQPEAEFDEAGFVTFVKVRKTYPIARLQVALNGLWSDSWGSKLGLGQTLALANIQKGLNLAASAGGARRSNTDLSGIVYPSGGGKWLPPELRPASTPPDTTEAA